MNNRFLAGITAALVVCLMALGGPLFAKPAQKRQPKVTHTETVTYAGASGVNTPNAAAWDLFSCDQGLPTCNSIPTERGDRYMTLEVTDTSGTGVDVTVSQTVGSGYTSFCSTSDSPVIPIAGGAPVYVWLTAGTCSQGTDPSVVTTGTIEATFFDMKPRGI